MKDIEYKGIIPPELVSEIKRGKCILFVGSGLSSQVLRSNNKPLPTWKSLLYEMLEWANQNRTPFWNDPKDIKEMIDKDNLTVAAQELQEVIGNSNLGDFYKSVFRDKNVKPSEVHKIIPLLPFRGVITTNYDTLIEGAYSLVNEGILPPIFTQKDLDDKNSFLRNNDFFIFKMHGHIDRLDSIILGKKSYDDILFRNATYRQFMETMFSVYTILFIGFGGIDDDLDNTFDKLSILYSRTLDKHYMLADESKYNFTEKRRLLLDKRIEIIEYKKDNSHSQVYAFLNELHKQTKRKEKEIEVFPHDNKNTKKIFLSSSSKDESISKIIYDYLIKNDYQVWHGDNEMKPGDILVQAISKAIHQSNVMIVLITENSVESTWVMNELQTGILKQISDKSIKVIPIVIGNVNVPSFLNQILYIKIENDVTETDLQILLDAIKN
jgi:NAD-dependent SIR2 family protein deacetylase